MDGYTEISNSNRTHLELNEFEPKEPINSSETTNYNTTGETEFQQQQSYYNHDTDYGADGGFNVTNTVPKFHNEHQMDCWMLTWKNFEQIKSITAGLLLLFCGGIHTVWPVYQIIYFHSHEQSLLKDQNLTDLNKLNRTSMHFQDIYKLKVTILMYYFGIIVGSAIAGYFLLPEVRKKNIYYIAALLMFISAALFYGSTVEKEGWQFSLTFARLFAGMCYGIAYVTVFVQTSENSTKEFRHYMIITIGGVIALSIVFASLCVVNIRIVLQNVFNEMDLEKSEVTAAYTIFLTTLFFCFISCIFNYIYTNETVPFLLKHNCRDNEAVYVLAKLRNEAADSIVIQSDFDAIQKMCENDYLTYPERKIFTRSNRKFLWFAMCGRLVAVLTFSVPVIVILTQFLQSDIQETLDEMQKDNSTSTLDKVQKFNSNQLQYQTSVKTVLFLWFSIGYGITFATNIFNWKRALERLVFITGIVLMLLTLLAQTGAHRFFDSVLNIFFIVYFKLLSLPVDINGYTYLTDCFPVTTKSWSIGFVTICENFVHILLILGDWKNGHFYLEFFIIGLFLAIAGFKLYVFAPDTKGMHLSEAQQMYSEATFNGDADAFTLAISKVFSRLGP